MPCLVQCISEDDALSPLLLIHYSLVHFLIEALVKGDIVHGSDSTFVKS